MPSGRSVMWGILFGLVSVWIVSNVAFVRNIVGPRTA